MHKSFRIMAITCLLLIFSASLLARDPCALAVAQLNHSQGQLQMQSNIIWAFYFNHGSDPTKWSPADAFEFALLDNFWESISDEVDYWEEEVLGCSLMT